MRTWLGELKGDEFDLEDLPTWFGTDDLTVERVGENYYLASADLENLEGDDAVRTRAKELVRQIVGAARLFRANFGSVELGGIIRRNENGTRNAYVFLSS